MKKKLLLLICSILAFQLPAFAQPSNDLICNASSITANGGCVNGTNVGATNSASPANPSCWGTTPSNDVWFSFVASNDSMTVSTDYWGDNSGDLTDTQVAVYSSSDNTCTGSLTQVGCDEDGGTNIGFNSIVTMTGLVVGNTYFVRVDGYSTSTGDFCITAADTPPPNENWGGSCTEPAIVYPNSTCSASSGSSAYINAAGNGNSTGLDQCGTDNSSAENTAWFTFTANSTTTTINMADFTGSATSNFHDVSVFSGTSCVGTLVTCQNTASKDPNSMTVSTTVGQTYLIMITNGSNYSGDVMSFCLIGDACTAPSNDNCAGATAITENTTYTATNACATADKALCSGSMENNVWYSWTVPATWPAGQEAFIHLWDQNCGNQQSAASSVQLSVYNASFTCASSGGAGTCVVFADQNTDSDVNMGWTPSAGQTYYFTFDGEGGVACTFKFSITTTVILPITLLNFSAADNGNKQVLLSWTTASEQNNDFFTIEKTVDGVKFEEVTRVKGSGNTNYERYYSATDDRPYNGVSYYRLKQTDYDGKFSYSDLVAVKMGDQDEQKQIVIARNPVKETLEMAFKLDLGGKSVISIYDATGNLVYKQAVNSTSGFNIFKTNVSSLTSGMYFITVSNGQEFQKTRFVKE